MTPIRILIVDDHAAVRMGVRVICQQQPGWEICGEAGDGWKGLEAAQELKPDVLVQDVSLPGLDGFEVLRQIKKARLATEIVIFTGQVSENLVHQVFDAGARSYILKTDESPHLLEAIRSAAAHKPYFTPWVSQVIYTRMQSREVGEEPPEPGSALSSREREALKIIASGHTNKELAASLGVSLRTAESHRAAIMKKLDLHNTGELIRYSIRNGIVEA